MLALISLLTAMSSALIRLAEGNNAPMVAFLLEMQSTLNQLRLCIVEREDVLRDTRLKLENATDILNKQKDNQTLFVHFWLMSNPEKPEGSLITCIKALRSIAEVSLKNAKYEIEVVKNGACGHHYMMKIDPRTYSDNDAVNTLAKHFDIAFVMQTKEIDIQF